MKEEETKSSGEDEEYSLYSDIAEVEYDYDEELYDETGEEEEENEARNLPTDPIGRIVTFVNDAQTRIKDELSILSRNIRIALALVTFLSPS